MAAVDVRKIIQELVVPELKEVKSELKVIRTEIKRLDEKIDSGLARLDGKIDSGLARLDGKIDALDEKVDSIRNELQVRERLAVLEEKVTALSR